MSFTLNIAGTATVGGNFVSTTENSAEPDWAFYLNNEAGITSAGGVVSAIADQSVYANNSSAVSGISVSTTTLVNGTGVLAFAGSSSYAKFTNIVAQNQRPELADGWAFVILAKIADSAYTHKLVQLGRYGDAIRYSGGQYNNRVEFMNGSGGGNIGLDTNEPNWAFRYVAVNTTRDTLDVGVGAKGAFARKFTLAGVNSTNVDGAYPLLLGNGYNEDTGAIALDGTVMSVRAAGIINPEQIEQCRRYWTARYNLIL